MEKKSSGVEAVPGPAGAPQPQGTLESMVAALDNAAGVDALETIAQAREALREAERRALVRARHEALQRRGNRETTSWTVLARQTGLSIPPIRRRVLAAEEALGAEKAGLEAAIGTCRATADWQRAVDISRTWAKSHPAESSRLEVALSSNPSMPPQFRTLTR